MVVQYRDNMKRGLENRHLQMIALGGAIGTGLFYGSAATIALAGPAVILSYLVSGIIVFLVMRMLGEMAVYEPVSGSFSYYADKYLGEFPGFLAGWTYWFEYIVVSMAELTAVGIYINFWLPDVPGWLSALVCLIVITAINLVNVRAYGETEFWLALIKIVAIISMIILGMFIIFNKDVPFPENVSNLWAYGGFFPNGLWGFLLSITVVMFSFGGIELIGITAGEASNPDRSIPRAINQVIWRILIFYVGTMSVLMILWPWNEIGTQASPLVQIFANVGIPAAAHILNFVVLTAAVSVYNSAIYSNSRMLFGLASSGFAPAFLKKLSSRNVPVAGIVISSGITLIIVVLNYFFPEHIFLYLLAVTVAAVVINWVTIIFTHIRFRRQMLRDGKTLKFPAPFFPFANYLCLAFCAMIIVMMTQLEDMQLAIVIMPFWLFLLYIIYVVKRR